MRSVSASPFSSEIVVYCWCLQITDNSAPVEEEKPVDFWHNKGRKYQHAIPSNDSSNLEQRMENVLKVHLIGEIEEGLGFPPGSYVRYQVPLHL